MVSLLTFLPLMLLGEPAASNLPWHNDVHTQPLFGPRMWRPHRAAFHASRKRLDSDKASMQDINAEDIADEIVENIDDQIDEQYKRAQKVGPKALRAPAEMPGELEEDFERFTNEFLPGLTIDPVLWWNVGSGIALTITWYVFYFTFIFKSDALRTQGAYVDGGADDTEKGELSPRQHTEKPKFLVRHQFAEGMEPDLVIVLPNPGVDFADGDREVSQSKLKHVLSSKLPGVPTDMAKFNALVESSNSATLKDARLALIGDLCIALPKLGFDIGLYRGVCGNRIFLCISMDEPHWIHKHLLWQHRTLQVHRRAVSNLGLGPVSAVASSPPHLIFDPWVVSQMHEAKIIGKDDPAELYVMRDDGFHTEGSIIMRQERIRIIFQQICAAFDLDAAKSSGLIRDWYPAHNLNWVEHIGALWAVPQVLTDLHFEQPMSLISNYFGTRVAFTFAWLGLFCKCLLALLPASMVWEVMSNAFAIPQVLIGSVGITIWAKIATNLWNREEAFFVELWGMSADEHTSIRRPQFRGKLVPSPVDESKTEIECPAWELMARWLASMFVTTLFCLTIMFLTYVWVSLFDGRMGIFASVCLVLQITFFRLIFNYMAKVLTDCENHKYQPAYYTSLLWKQVFFSSVNNYYAFFYLAIKQRYTRSGCEGGCLNLLRRQLVYSLLLLSLIRIGEALLETFKVRFALWMEERRRQRQLGSRERVKRCYAETQASYSEFRIQQQIEMMSQLIISLGFVILFGGVAPLIVPFCLVVFVIQFRITAYLLMTTTKRPFPRRAFGIGAWTKVLTFLRSVGALFSAYLLAVYGAMFRGQQTITRLSGMFGFCIFVFVLWLLVDLFCPSASPETDLLKERRDYVKNRLMEVCASTAHSKIHAKSQTQRPLRHALSGLGPFPTSEALGATTSVRQSLRDALEQRWDKIPTFSQAEASHEIATDDEGEGV